LKASFNLLKRFFKHVFDIFSKVRGPHRDFNSMLVLLLVLLQLLLLLLLQLVLLLQCRVEHAVRFFEHLGSIFLVLRSCESFSLSSSDSSLILLRFRCLHRCFSYSD